MDKYQEYELRWLQCMERIGRKELWYFEQDNIGYTEQIISLNCRRSIMCWVYSELKRHKKLIPIENLDIDVKKEMWKFVTEICTGKSMDKNRKIEIAKTFYTLEYFLKQKEV